MLPLIQSWLNGSGQKWLLVLDNVDDGSYLFEPSGNISRQSSNNGYDTDSNTSLWEYVRPTGNAVGSVLVTSRYRNEARKLVRERDIVEVKRMSEALAAKLIIQLLTARSDPQGVHDLAKALEGVPLAIAQATAYINRKVHDVQFNSI